MVPLVIAGKEQGEGGSVEGQGPAQPPSKSARAEVWEIWSRRHKERIWVATGHDKLLRVDPDPLGLKDFFPCPEPLYSIRTSDTLVPLPEFTLYEDQADELDEIQSRIRHLVTVLRAVVLVDGDFAEVVKIASATDGTAIPLDRPGDVAEDLGKRIWWWPLETIVQVISTLTARAEQLERHIWQVTGLHDLQRGSTMERESAAAQKLKAGFGQVRMTPRSLPMARYVRDCLRLKSEVMAELFDQATLERIGGVPVTPEMMKLLREEKLRNTNVAVATDSTVRPDQAAEKEEATEFLAASSSFLQQIAAVGQVQPAMVPLMLETFKQAARTFKWSRTIEPMIDQTVQLIGQQVAAQLQLQEAQVAMQQQALQQQQMMAAQQAQMAGAAPMPNGGGMM